MFCLLKWVYLLAKHTGALQLAVGQPASNGLSLEIVLAIESCFFEDFQEVFQGFVPVWHLVYAQLCKMLVCQHGIWRSSYAGRIILCGDWDDLNGFAHQVKDSLCEGIPGAGTLACAMEDTWCQVAQESGDLVGNGVGPGWRKPFIGNDTQYLFVAGFLQHRVDEIRAFDAGRHASVDARDTQDDSALAVSEGVHFSSQLSGSIDVQGLGQVFFHVGCLFGSAKYIICAEVDVPGVQGFRDACHV